MKRKWFAALSAAVLGCTAIAAPVQAETVTPDFFPPDAIAYMEEQLGTTDYMRYPIIVTDYFTGKPRRDGDLVFANGELYWMLESRLYSIPDTDKFMLPPTKRGFRLVQGYSSVYHITVEADHPLTIADFPELENWELSDYGTNCYRLYPKDGTESLIRQIPQVYPQLQARDDLQTCALGWSLAGLAFEAEYISSYGSGDFNGDDVLDVRDAILMARSAAGDKSLPILAARTETNETGDMNYDGIISAADVTLLLQKLAKY